MQSAPVEIDSASRTFILQHSIWRTTGAARWKLNEGENTMNGERFWKQAWLTLPVIALVLTLTLTAQVQTNTTTQSAAPTVQTSVERGEVVHVSGNDVVVKMEDGTIRDFNNVPESARISVDGKEIGIHDLKPGMKLEKTITTTSTPKTITTVETVTGKVFQVTPPVSVILTLADGSNQKFKIPKDQKFSVNGQEVDAFHLKKGMTVSATKVVETPTTELEHQAKVTGQMPPPPQPPPSDAPILVAVIAVPAAPNAAPSRLPNTGSPLPLIGLLGILLVACPLGLKAFQKVRHHA
jgi:hypothetical protein